MAIMKNNPLFQGISGSIGGIVFRQHNGKTIVTSKPYCRKKKTTKQTAHQARFMEAVLYAKMTMLEEPLKDYYADFAKQSKCSSPYQAAVKDFLTEPKISKVDASRYRGKKGDVILVTPEFTKKFLVVMVSIKTSGGNIIESGLANSDAADIEYAYTATQNNYVLDGCLLTVEIIDTPGHSAKIEFEYQEKEFENNE
jgi:hypothetical protein